MRVAEPMTLVTDWVLAGLSAFFAARLLAAARQRASLPMRVWGWAFVTSALGAFLGGAYHGFSPKLAAASRAALWKATIFAIGFTSYFIAAAVVLAQLPRRLHPWLVAALAVKLTAYLAWMTAHDEFRYVVYEYASSMIVALAVQTAFLRNPGARWIAGGILVSFAAAGVQQSGYAMHRHLDHNVLYHIIQMGALWMLHRGGMRLESGLPQWLRQQRPGLDGGSTRRC